MNLCELRRHHTPVLPKSLEKLAFAAFEDVQTTSSIGHHEEIRERFPDLYGASVAKIIQREEKCCQNLRVGVVLSGGQAPGGHNVIAGLFDALLELHSGADLIGFLDGPAGIINGEYKNLEKPEIDECRGQGGFDVLGSGRDKIETKEQLDRATRVIKKLNLDGLVIIGGDDSNTNAAILAQHLKTQGIQTSVTGIPKTIDGDLKNEYVEVSFGFDTATKTYSEMIGNIAKDALSSKKYYHFVKVMGRSASHIALECALYTHPNLVLLSEEIMQNRLTLNHIVEEIADMIRDRAKRDKHYGVIVIPEGIIESIPEFSVLIKELNALFMTGAAFDASQLTASSQHLYHSLPESIQKQLIMDTDPHGNVRVSQIRTEELLIELVKKKLGEREFEGSFSPVEHFFGYEGRSALPSNFDANYCYALGRAASLCVGHGYSGYMVAIQNLKDEPRNWDVFALPITSLLNMEERKGKRKPVIQKALVDLSSAAFHQLQSLRESWKLEDDYQFPGPIQFFGHSSVTETPPLSLMID